MSDPSFSVAEHARFVAGYPEAVRNVTDIQGLGARYFAAGACAGPVQATTFRIENWSREFDAFVQDVLQLDPRSRLGFYLVDYLCWFRDFTTHAECFRAYVAAGEAAAELNYRLVWPDGACVVVSAIPPASFSC